jgi:TetR/AcrR family transcriptional regulator
MGTEPTPVVEKKPRRYLQRGLETRNRILQVAVGEFAQRGFEGTSTRAIAKLSDVPHTLIMYYFKSKEELWITSAKELLQPFIDREKQLVSELVDKSAAEQLKIIYADFIRFSAAVPLFHRMMANEGREKSERLIFLINSLNRRSTDLLAQLIRDAQAQGDLLPGDPYLMVYIMVGAATNPFAVGAEFEIISGRSPFSPEAVEEHLNICLRLFFP